MHTFTVYYVKGADEAELTICQLKIILIHIITYSQVQYRAIKRLSRVEYFTTTVVNNLLYYLGTQPILM